jgi:hypothetical protein
MGELLSRVSSGDLTMLLAMALVIVGPILAVVALFTVKGLWQHRQRQLATSLILEMLDRGMTADDIVHVLAAAGLEDRPDELLARRRRVQAQLGEQQSEPAKTAAGP